MLNKYLNIMKNTIKKFGIGFGLMVLFAFNVQADNKEMIAKYWVVESNIYDKTFSIVKFYNDNDVLLIERKIEGKQLKLTRKNIRKLSRELKKYNESLQKRTSEN